MLFMLRARSIFRKSSKEPGKVSVWLVLGKTQEQATKRWKEKIGEEHRGHWTFETIEPYVDEVKRIF